MLGALLLLSGCSGELPTREEALRPTPTPAPVTTTQTGTTAELNTDITTLSNDVPPTPYPNRASLILNFFSQLSTGHLDTALRYLPETNREMWRPNLASIQALAISDIKVFDPNNWTANQQQYKVVVNVTPSGDGNTYCWENGDNIRYITIQNIDGQWKIVNISPQL